MKNLGTSALGLQSKFSRRIAKYIAVAKVNALNTKTHWPNMFARSLAIIVRVWIFTQLYQATFAETNSTIINGFSLSMVIWSLMLAQSFDSATRPSVSQIIGEEVQDGTVAYAVSKPYSYILFHAGSSIGRTIPTLISNLAIGALAALILVGPTSIELPGIILGTINLFLGYLLDFSIALLIGLSALWFENISAFTSIYHKCRLVFSGLIIPIALFPPLAQQIVSLLPFSHIYYTAAKQIVHFSLNDFLISVTLQLIWITVFFTLGYMVFSRSLRQLSVNGG